MRLGIVILIALVASTLSTVSTADVVDGDFELTGANGGWTYKSDPNNADQDAAAPGIDAAIEGNETLMITGNFLGGATTSFSEVYQDVAVDGVNYSIGDVVEMKAFLAHLSTNPLTSSNTAFIEIGFISNFGETGSLGSIGLTAGSDQDVYSEFATDQGVIPNFTTAIRVKIKYTQQGNTTGAAYAENVRLINVTTIPEPGALAFLAFGMAGLAVRRRR